MLTRVLRCLLLQPAALFAGLSLVEHSCLPNARLVTEPGASLQTALLVTRDVRRGEALSRDYRPKQEW